MSSIRTLRSRIFQKETAPSFVLVMNSFVWYVLVYFTLSNIITQSSFKDQSVGLFAVYFAGIAVAAIAGSKFRVRSRGNLLKVWMFLGALATFLLAFVSSRTPIFDGLVITFLGASIGLGLPSCLSYFAKQAAIEKRGLISGTIWSTVAFSVLLLGILTSSLGAISLILILGCWRLIGGVIFFFLDRKPIVVEEQKNLGYLYIIRKKETLLFLLPWVMFMVINFAEKPMLQNFFGVNQYSLVESAEFIFIGIFAFIGGLVADIGGRKRVIIAGFVMLGFEYATLSAFSGYTNTILVSYIFMVLDGITWGLLFSVFFTVVWGDLGENNEKEKFYVLGGIPLLLTNFLSVLIAPYAASISFGTAFTLASFFLFVAVIPLMYAPETLPEKSIKDRDLKSYVEKATKAAQKITQKGQNKETKEISAAEKDEKNETYAEAVKLAEKYY
jgi:MFS family permease